MNSDFGRNSTKQFVNGLHRICSARETLERVLPVAREFGITRVANVTGLDRIGLPVVIAMRPNARSIAVSQGKGVTLDQAKASAVMEAIEIWHAEHFDKPVFFASISDLSGRQTLIDLDRLARVPGPGHTKSQRLHWIEAHDVMSGEQRLVPLEMVHADYTHPLPPDAGHFPASTNGLASGNHMLEAICHGICEVIERDALAVWHHLAPEAQRASRLALASVDDTPAQDALRMIADAGLDCAVWDVTSDIRVASFLCVIHDPRADEDHLGLGSGTHPDRTVALLRALTEAAQTRLNYISGAREDLSFAEYSAEGRAAKPDAFAGLLGDAPRTRRFDEVPTQHNNDLASDLDWLKQQLRIVGIEEVAVVDLTRDDFAIPVARVIIPGLEAPHDDESYVAGPRAQAVTDRGQTP